MIIAVTGATGFIGRKLVLKHLCNGDQVRVLTRRTADQANFPDGVALYPGDLSQAPELREFVRDVDVLYHCAGEIRDTDRMEAVHIRGTQALVDAAAGHVRHWVQLSSVGVYGPIKDGVVTEQTAFNPVGIYEVTKLISDQIVQTAAQSRSFTYSIVRPSNVFGPDMSNRSLFSMIDMIDRGLFFFIGKPGSSANYVHVDNVIEAMHLCSFLPQAKGRDYNISQYCPLEEWVDAIGKELGLNVRVHRIPKLIARTIAFIFSAFKWFPLTSSRVSALTNQARYSTTRISKELGYRDVKSLEDGIKELVVAYSACKHFK